MPSESSAAGEKIVNWETAKVCLAELARVAPALLKQGVVIGGAACWFYRHLLTKANDPDFKLPEYSAEEEAKWLSKDIDFTNVFAEDARQMLASRLVTDAAGRKSIRVAGVPIGFAQVGVTFDPEGAWEDAWIAEFNVEGAKVECQIIDPIRLYIEKQALAQRRGSESDGLHLRALAEFLRFEIRKRIEALARGALLEEQMRAVKFLSDAANKTSELCRDERIAKAIVKIELHRLSRAERDVIERLREQ